MSRTSRYLLYAGLGVGVGYTLLGTFLPGGGLRWFLHTPAGHIGLPLGLALLAAGAVVGRLDRAEAETAALRDSALPDADFPSVDIAASKPVRDRDRAL